MHLSRHAYLSITIHLDRGFCCRLCRGNSKVLALKRIHTLNLSTWLCHPINLGTHPHRDWSMCTDKNRKRQANLVRTLQVADAIANALAMAFPSAVVVCNLTGNIVCSYAASRHRQVQNNIMHPLPFHHIELLLRL